MQNGGWPGRTIGIEGGGIGPHPGWGCGLMAVHEVTFPITDEAEIIKLRAGDEVVVQGHIIGIRDRTQIRIFDQGIEPPMDLTGAFLLHTAPGVRKLGTDSEGRGSRAEYAA